MHALLSIVEAMHPRPKSGVREWSGSYRSVQLKWIGSGNRGVVAAAAWHPRHLALAPTATGYCCATDLPGPLPGSLRYVHADAA